MLSGHDKASLALFAPQLTLLAAVLRGLAAKL